MATCGEFLWLGKLNEKSHSREGRKIPFAVSSQLEMGTDEDMENRVSHLIRCLGRLWTTSSLDLPPTHVSI